MLFRSVVNSVRLSYFYDGNSWTQLSNQSFNGSVKELIPFNNGLVAFGEFNTPSTDIAFWDGATWSAIGDEIYPDSTAHNVYDIEVYNNELYAVGDFGPDEPDPINTKYIAKWNGESWEQVGIGLNGAANCMFSWNNELYIGGRSEEHTSELSHQ